MAQLILRRDFLRVLGGCAAAALASVTFPGCGSSGGGLGQGSGRLSATVGSSTFTGANQFGATYVASGAVNAYSPPGLVIQAEDNATNLFVLLIQAPINGPGSYTSSLCNIQYSGGDGTISVASLSGISVTLTAISTSGGSDGFGNVSGTFSGTLITDDGQGSNVALSGSFSVPVTNSASSESAAVRKLIYVRQSR